MTVAASIFRRLMHYRLGISPALQVIGTGYAVLNGRRAGWNPL